MKVSYFPGCTLKNKAKILDEYARKSALALGVELEEIKEWQCCGGVFTTSKDEIATKLSSVRALMDARDNGQALVSVCSACHNVIKQTNFAMQTDKEFADKVNRYMQNDNPYLGETQVYHFLELLRDVVGFDKLKEKVVNPLKGKKIGAYYGCLLLRPSNVLAFDNPENPTIIEDLLKALGADVVKYPFRNECCGAYVSIKNAELTEKKSSKIIENAKKAGAEVIVTACPLCYYNLKTQANGEIEVKYITELLADALGVKED